jgi:hypothetical protein
MRTEEAVVDARCMGLGRWRMFFPTTVDACAWLDYIPKKLSGETALWTEKENP